MHQRQAIRDAIAATLISGVPLVDSKVFKSRVFPMNEASLPGICIYTTDETAEIVTTAGFPRSSQRNTTVRIEISVKGIGAIDDQVDAICAQVEIAMAQNIGLNQTAVDNQYTGLEISLNGDNTDNRQGEKTGVAIMTYDILYFVPENNPEF